MTAVEQAQEVAKHAREHHGQQAVREMHEHLRGMNTSQRRDFYHELARQKGQPGGLPGFEIHGDEQHHNRSVAVQGQRPEYQESDGGSIRAKQGPADALQRQHPDWSWRQVHEEAGRINKETGLDKHGGYREGDQITRNPDGSVSLRRDDPKHPGSFSESRYKDGHKLSTRAGDDKQWTKEQYGPNGHLTSKTKHESSDDGGYKETKTGPDGKDISTKTRTMSPDGSYKERETDAKSHNFRETNYDVDGKPTHTTDRTYPDPNKPNEYSEVRRQGDEHGTITSRMDRHPESPNSDVSVERTTRQTGRSSSTEDRRYKGDELQHEYWLSHYYHSAPDPERLSV